MLWLAVFILSLLAVWYFRIWISNFPPGPTPLPFIGNIHQIARRGADNIGTTLTEWGLEYGDMFTVYFGQQKSIVLNSYDVINEVFSMPVFAGRPRTVLTEIFGNGKGISLGNGPIYQEQRRFSLMHLKILDFGKTTFEDKIVTEIQLLLEELEGHTGKPFDIKEILNCSVVNIISSILLGKRFDFSDPRLKQFMVAAADDVIKPAFKVAALDQILPFLRHLPGDVIGVGNLKAVVGILNDFIRDIIKAHKLEPDSFTDGDLIDVYLARIKRDDGETSFTEDRLEWILFDFFLGGYDTTSTTIYWALLYLVNNSHVLSKAIKEINDVIGPQKQPSLQDRPNLPYLEAVITETHRLARLLPTGFPHAPMEDTVLRGYLIPKGTTIIPNMTAVFLDESVFTNPNSFRPERFLDGDGQINRSLASRVIPFGIGRRACPGESLARMELFLFMASILQKFTFSVPEGAPLPSTIGLVGSIRHASAYELCFNRLK